MSPYRGAAQTVELLHEKLEHFPYNFPTSVFGVEGPRMLSSRLKQRPLTSWMLVPAIVCYCLFCVLFFVKWVDPSLQGISQQHIAADSTTYMYIADVLHGKYFDPLALASLASFPNTLWMPVAIAFVLKSTLAIAALDILAFATSIWLFTKTSSKIDPIWLVALLLVNPTTGISLLSVNKEIIDLFALALFFYSRSKARTMLLLLALILALLNRYEVCFSMILFLLVQSRLNPWKAHRLATLVALALAMTIALPHVSANTLETHFAEAQSAGLVRALDTLEMHYLYVVAVLPKIAENLFGQLLNISQWSEYSFDNLANSYILFLNNLACFFVVVFLAFRRSLSIRNEWIYFAALASIVMASSLVNQPRYFYIVYVLLCLQAADKESGIPLVSFLSDSHAETAHA
jgi:hypothetical protein